MLLSGSTDGIRSHISTRERAVRELEDHKCLMFQFFNSRKLMEGANDVLKWYALNKGNITMIKRFARLVLSIPPIQIKNERLFSLAGVIPRTIRGSLIVKSLARSVLLMGDYEMLKHIRR